MKRSEMIEKLEETLKYGKKDRLAQDILFTIEHFGMLPPGGLEVVSPSIIYYSPFGDVREFEEKDDISLLWEQEDEIKN